MADLKDRSEEGGDNRGLDENRFGIGREGDGVVGQFPKISVGDNFSYNSYHVVDSDCVVEGSFFGETDTGIPIFTRIPRFELNVPKWA